MYAGLFLTAISESGQGPRALLFWFKYVISLSTVVRLTALSWSRALCYKTQELVDLHLVEPISVGGGGGWAVINYSQ